MIINKNNYITASESTQHQCIDEEKFYYVDDHTTQRYLKRSKMRIYAEYVHELQKTVQNC